MAETEGNKSDEAAKDGSKSIDDRLADGSEEKLSTEFSTIDTNTIPEKEAKESETDPDDKPENEEETVITVDLTVNETEDTDQEPSGDKSTAEPAENEAEDSRLKESVDKNTVILEVAENGSEKKQDQSNNSNSVIGELAVTETEDKRQRVLSQKNSVIVDLAVNDTEKHSPEIVVEPKLLERHSNGKHRRHKPHRHISQQNGRHVRKSAQSSSQKNFRVQSPKYYPNNLLQIKTQSEQPSESTVTSPATSDKNGCCYISKYIILYILLTATVAGYAVGGAYLFSHLEKKREIEYNDKIDKWKNDTAILLATELRQVTPHEAVWARKVFEYLEVYEKDLLKASSIGYRRFDDEDREKRWTLTSSLFFSISLMTTTGYGSMTPRSQLGRTAAAIYSLFGIPIAFFWLMTTGHSLAIGLTTIFRSVCCSLCAADTTKKSGNPQITQSSKMMQKSGWFKSNSVSPIEEKKLITQQNGSAQLPKEKVLMSPTHFDKLYNSRFVLLNHSVSDCNNTYCKTARDHFEMDLYERQTMPKRIEILMTMIYSILFFFIYFTFCSIAFALKEGWELLDIFYFNLLMFLTLGPGCHELEKDSSEIKLKSNPIYLLFLILGYCILSAIVNLVYLLVRKRSYPYRIELSMKDSKGITNSEKY